VEPDPIRDADASGRRLRTSSEVLTIALVPPSARNDVSRIVVFSLPRYPVEPDVEVPRPVEGLVFVALIAIGLVSSELDRPVVIYWVETAL
jgi:hypothetical protein